MTRPLRRAALALTALACLSASASALTLEKVRLASGRSMNALPGQVIVRYRDGAVLSGRSRLAAMGAQSRARVDAIRLELVSVPKGQTVESFLAQLRSNPDVEFAEPNGVMHALSWPTDGTTEPNDANFAGQYALRYNDSNFPANIHVGGTKGAWAITRGDPSIVVAVVDTGADLNNPDFQNIGTTPKFVQGAVMELDWENNGNCTDTPQNDPNLSGVGPDMCAGDNPEDDDNVNPTTGLVDPSPTYHGTRVSGVIAATANDGVGIAGIAPDCRIMPVKVLNSWGFGSFFSIASGISWAVDHGASVINLSLGGETADVTGAIQAAVNHALEKNCVVVAAAGNSGNESSVNFPASIDGIIAVGAIDQTNALTAFSATGRQLDLVAPGQDIYSTVPSTVSATTANTESGTSFSSPMVAGVAALIRSIKPATSWEDVTKYIDFTAHDLGASGYDTSFGFGRLDAGAAVAAAQAGRVFVSNPADPSETFTYPNPFHPGNGNVVSFSLPQSLGTDGISIDILNMAGEKIRTLSGTIVWDGTTDSGDIAAAGFYFYRAKTSQGDAKGKLTLIK